jgi:hypothetical protein
MIPKEFSTNLMRMGRKPPARSGFQPEISGRSRPDVHNSLFLKRERRKIRS